MSKARSHLYLALFSKFKDVFARLIGPRLVCECLHRWTYDGNDRVQQINASAPDCMCERHRMSKYSAGVVNEGELLSRFVFSPIHYNKKTGRLKPSLFSYAADRGCSIQRESLATPDEIVKFVTEFLQRQGTYVWYGVVVGDCENVRGIRLNGMPNRTVCVYDTAERSNPAHAEICLTHFALEDGDANEMRRHLMTAFNTQNLISPGTYQSGRVWARLPSNLRTTGP